MSPLEPRRKTSIAFANRSRRADLQPVEQLLDPVLDVTARAIDFLVEGPRRSTQVGHDEAGIVPRLAARESDDLGLVTTRRCCFHEPAA